MIFVKSLFRLFLKDLTLEILHENCENTGFLEARVSQTVEHESQREKRLA